MNALTTFALLYLLAVALSLAAAAAALVASRRVRRRRGPLAALAALALACTILAQKQHVVRVSVDAYLRDEGCSATNDVFSAVLSVASPLLPGEFNINVYRREAASEDAADWSLLAPSPVAWSGYAPTPTNGVRRFDYASPNATNYDYLVMADFVPEPTVHTNGVWQIRGFEVPARPGTFAFPNTKTRREQ